MEEDIVYIKGSKNERHLLDIFYDKDGKDLPIIVFIHGGSWHEGRKEIYRPLGENFCRNQQVVCAVINYRLAPKVNITEMATDCAMAVSWLAENIKQYGGDPQNIFLMGHSAGGHLSALISMNREFFPKGFDFTSIRGCILNDAFGLNMADFLTGMDSWYHDQLKKVFTHDPGVWERSTPVKHLKQEVPFLIFTGEKTYPVIEADNSVFIHNLIEQKVPHEHHIIKGKTHYGMISQLESANNKLYGVISDFIKKNLRKRTAK